MNRERYKPDREKGFQETRSDNKQEGISSSNFGSDPIHSVHRAVGNQAAQQLVGGSNRQPKPAVNSTGNQPEQETERGIGEMTRPSDPSSVGVTEDDSNADSIQRMCTRCKRRFREGKPLNCDTCERELQNHSSPTEMTTVESRDDRTVQLQPDRSKPQSDSLQPRTSPSDRSRESEIQPWKSCFTKAEVDFDHNSGEVNMIVDTDCCTEDCTRRHEQQHIEDLADCYKRIYDKFGSTWSPDQIHERWQMWLREGAHAWSECNAYKVTLECAAEKLKEHEPSQRARGGRASQDTPNAENEGEKLGDQRGGGRPECYEVIKGYIMNAEYQKQKYCSKAPSSPPPCPITTEDDSMMDMGLQ